MNKTMQALYRQFAILLLALGASLWGSSAMAQEYTQITSQELQTLMTAKGYATELDSDGDIIWTVDGIRTLVMVSQDKESVQFLYGVRDKVSWEAINAWNSSKRYSRSFLDKSGSPMIKLDLDLAGGISRGRLYDYLVTARTSMLQWRREVLGQQ